MLHKIITLTLALLFALFAYFQLNDPDPALWVAIYTYVALIGFSILLKKTSTWLIYFGLAICGAGTLYLLPSVYHWLTNHADVSLLYGMAPDKPYIEESRECGGLFIAFLGLLYFYFRIR
jgi:hypothetical protein